MTSEVEQSYRRCHALTRERARNFYYAFWLFPKERRDAFCAVYAFMRFCDDIADGDASLEEKASQLHGWHVLLDRALQGDVREHWILPAFHDAARRYSIPAEHLHHLISGAEMDLSIRTYETFRDLYQYCYHVASVVGLCSLQIMGYRDPEATKLAEECGIAFQLTNILRDVREDAAAGRVYLPLEDLERFGYPPDQLATGVYNREFASLMRFEIERAENYYKRSEPLIQMVEPESRPALWTLISIYRGVLRVISRNQGNVFTRRAALSEMEKIAIVAQAAAMQLRHRIGGEPVWGLGA